MGEGRGHKNLIFFQKVEIIFKNQKFSEFFDSIITCIKILKTLKNWKLVSQLAKICLRQTGVFLRIQDLKLFYAQNFQFFKKS